MIGTLEEAWVWYQSAKSVARVSQRVGLRFWDRLPSNDNVLEKYDSANVVANAKAVSDDLDDLCVLLLFSVFESIVRERILKEIVAAAPSNTHPVILAAIGEARDRVESGSFGLLLQSYKIVDADVVEGVNQVRKFRNWVAHGRRGAKPTIVEPKAALDRLQLFLRAMNK